MNEYIIEENGDVPCIFRRNEDGSYQKMGQLFGHDEAMRLANLANAGIDASQRFPLEYWDGVLLERALDVLSGGGKREDVCAACRGDGHRCAKCNIPLTHSGHVPFFPLGSVPASFRMHQCK